MWNLNFITRNDLKEHIKNTIATYEKTLDGIDLSRFNSNIVDPIKWYLIVKYIGRVLRKLLRMN